MSRSLFALLTLCACSVASGAEQSTPSAVPLTTLEGKATTLAANAGKAATVVCFVSFDCPVSNSYVAQLNDLATSHGEKGVAVVLVCPTDDKPEAVKKAAAGFKLTIPVLIDTKKELASALKAEITPEVFLLNSESKTLYRGRIDDGYSARLKKNPTVTSHDLTAALTAVLAGQPVKVAQTKAIGCAIDYDTAPRTGTVTYSKHVAPILNAHCVVCHRAGELAPFSLTSYNNARRWAEDIKEFTANRSMPPWMPAHGVAMKGERKMTGAEIATLAAWANGGAPEGDPKDAPKPPDFGDGWRHGKPDMILTPGDDFALGGAGSDLFRVFVVPTGLTEDKWVIGYDVKPGNPRVVHHTLHFFDTTGQGRELEKKQQEKDKGRLLLDKGPGYTVGMGVGFVPARGDDGAPKFGGIGGWAPGQGPQFVPKGAGWLLPKGSDFLIQTHYHRNGQFATDRTQVGLYFAKSPVDQPWQTLILNGFRAWEKIPAGKADYVARGGIYLHSDAVLHNVLPHMHLRGKNVKVTMTPPDGGKPVVLVDIPAWDYRWQETYWFAEPITAKAGTRLQVTAIFDNSEQNPNNPTRPPQEVSYGEETTDEMLYVFFGATSLDRPSKRLKTYGFPPTSSGTAPVAGQMTPLLEGLVGTWDTTTEVKVAGRGITLKGKDVTETAFGGTYVRGLTTNAADERGAIILITFDPAAKVYRMWMYDSLGSEFIWTGTHDEQAKEITWTADVADGVKGAMTWKLADTGGYTWEVKITSAGKTMMEMNGDRTKKK